MRHLTRPLLVLAILAMALSTTVGSQGAPRKKLLLLTHAGLYKHTSLEQAEKVLPEMGKNGGYDVTSLQGFKQEAAQIDLSMLTPEYLSQFDALMLFTNGNLPLTDVQKKGIVDFVKNGKALIGVHCATLTMYNYPEFGEVLGGYYLRSIIPTAQITQGRSGILKVEDQKHPATKMLGQSWPINEEFYEFGRTVWDASKPTENVSAVGRLPILMPFSRDRVHVLLSLDTERTDLTGLTGMVKGGDYPQAWTHEVGKGRVFYTTLGHRDDIWTNDAVFRAHVNGGIRWATGLEN